MESTNAVEDEAPRMTLFLNITTVEGRSDLLYLTPESDREQVEQEIREGLLQDTFVEVDTVVGAITGTTFLKASGLLGITVFEAPEGAVTGA